MSIVNGFTKWSSMLSEDIVGGEIPDEVTYKGYTTKNLHHSEDARRAFLSTIQRAGEGKIHDDSDAILHALKATDTYMKLNDMHLEQGKAPDEAETKKWVAAHQEARKCLHHVGEFMHHLDYWHMHEHELQNELTQYNPETAGAEMIEQFTPEQIDELEDKTLLSYKAKAQNQLNKSVKDLASRKLAKGVDPSTLARRADGIKMAHKKLGEDIELEEASSAAARFNQKVKQAQNAHESGDHKKAKYHLDVARNFMLGINSNDHSKIKDSYPKYKELRKMHEEVELDEELTDKTIKSGDKAKVARVLADMLGVENAESLSPDNAINTGLRKIRSKRLTPEFIGVVKKMLALATDVGIKVDMTLVPKAVTEEVVDKKSTRNAANGILRFNDHAKLSMLNQGIVPVEEAEPMEKLKDPSQVGHSLDHKGDDHLRRRKVMYKTEEVSFELDEAADMSSLRKQLNKHTELAVKANKAGDDEQTKKHQGHINKIKEKMGKLVKEDALVVYEERRPPEGMSAKEYAKHELGRQPAAKLKVGAQVRSVTANGTVKDIFDKKMQTTGKMAKFLKVVDRQGREHDVRLTSDVQVVSEEVEQIAESEDVVTTADTKLDKKGRKVPAHRIVFKDGERDEDRDSVKEEAGDMSDDELDKMANNVTDVEHIIDLYDDDELAIVDDETGEKLEESLEEQQLNEVLSRMERMRARMRFLRTASKRERRLKIVLHRRSDTKTLNKRARRLAINMIKQRMMKKPVSQLTVAEKERVEKMLEKRKALIDRLAMRLTPRVRRIESDRLSHQKTTSKAPAPGM